MNSNGTPIKNEELAEEFAKMFEKKIDDTTLITNKKIFFPDITWWSFSYMVVYDPMCDEDF